MFDWRATMCATWTLLREMAFCQPWFVNGYTQSLFNEAASVGLCVSVTRVSICG